MFSWVRAIIRFYHGRFKPLNLKQPKKAIIKEVIFGADTYAGWLFDVLLLVAILLSVFVVMLESVQEIYLSFNHQLLTIEWVLTILFTIEFGLRIWTSEKPRNYLFSFYGIVDFLSIMPSYLILFFAESHFLVTIRILRLFRIFRLLKLARYINEAEALGNALRASRRKIFVFLGFLFTICILLGSFMFVIEGPETGFTSIPRSIYWAVVTLTTVGYGDIAPQTVLGQMLATVIMITGYSIIAVPTGIVSAEFAHAKANEKHKIHFLKSSKNKKCNSVEINGIEIKKIKNLNSNST